MSREDFATKKAEELSRISVKSPLLVSYSSLINYQKGITFYELEFLIRKDLKITWPTLIGTKQAVLVQRSAHSIALKMEEEVSMDTQLGDRTPLIIGLP